MICGWLSRDGFDKRTACKLFRVAVASWRGVITGTLGRSTSATCEKPVVDAALNMHTYLYANDT